MNDFFNGMFELGGAFVLLMHLRRLLRDKCIRGFSPIPMIWFWSWGAFNLYFYPSVDCWWSFTGGLCVFFVNTVYALMLWHYRKN